MAEKHETDVAYIDRIASSPPNELLKTTTTRRTELPSSLRNLTREERLAAEKKLVRKIDFRLLPMLVLMYIMNYLDRNNIAAARLTGKVGLQKGLGMNDTQYQTCVSILFVGYLLMRTSLLSLSLPADD